MLICCVRFSFSPLHSIFDVCPKLIITYASFLFFSFIFGLAIEFIVQNIKFNIVVFMMFQSRDICLFSLVHGVRVCVLLALLWYLCSYCRTNFGWDSLYGEIGWKSEKTNHIILLNGQSFVPFVIKTLSFLCFQFRCNPKRNEHILWLFM